MDLLATVLKFKVGFTLIFWFLPLSLFPDTWFVWMGMPKPEPMVFLRLLGAAFLALAVGYVSGIRRLRRGEDVRNIVWVGITSNGLSSLILVLFGIAGAWEDWDLFAQGYMWGSALVTALITMGLVVAGLVRGNR